MAFSQSFKPTRIVQHDLGDSPQAIDATSTVQNYPLGTRITARDPVLGESEFVYAQGVANTAAGNFVVLNPDGTTTRAAGGTAKGKVGIAMSANVANQFGWYCVKGKCLVTIAADVTANLEAYGAAAGVLADDVVATNHIVGAMLLAGLNAGGSAIPGTSETTAASQTVAVLDYPTAVIAV